MRILVLGDLHIEESSIPELQTIINKEVFSIKADKVVQTGDYYNKNRPTPKELAFGTALAIDLAKHYNEVIILNGNGEHEIYNNFAVTSYLGLLPGVKVVPEYIENNIYFGHFMLYESKLEYGTGKCGIKDLEHYKWVFLGHQHNPQDLSKTIFHIGSIRYCNFNEVGDLYKRVAVIKDNNSLEFISLKTPRKMVDVKSISELEDVEFDSKVRLVISSFNQFKKEINLVPKYKNQYTDFKIKLDFAPKVEDDLVKAKANKKLEDILKDGINNIKDEEVRKLLEEQFNEDK